MEWARTDLYAGKILVTPPGAAQGACSVCRGNAFIRGLCAACANNALFNEGRLADAVVPISLAIGWTQLATDLRFYKDPNSFSQRSNQAVIEELLARFATQHGACVRRALGVDRIDVVATVPSTRKRDDEHPLATIVRMMFTNQYQPILESNVDRTERLHQVDPSTFKATRRMDGQNVCIIEDTWTRGGNAQSAAMALKQAGAAKVAIIAVGRWMHAAEQDPKCDPDHAKLVELSRKQRPFTWDRCCIDWDDAEKEREEAPDG